VASILLLMAPTAASFRHFRYSIIYREGDWLLDGWKLLVFLCGGIGTFIADRLKLEKKDVALLVYSTIAGAFGGFLGSPIVGAIGAVEYMYIKDLDFYRHLIPGLLAAASGYVMYFAVLHTSYLGIYKFPAYTSPHLIDLGWAVLVGVIAGFVGIMFKLIFDIVHHVFSPLNRRPVFRAIVGGMIIGFIGLFLPLTLYSGQEQLLQIIHNPAACGAGLLILMLLVKALLTSTSFATGFDGGPLFPLIFIGGTLALATSQILTFIPQGVGVTAGMAGVTAAAFPIPLTVILMLGLLGDNQTLHRQSLLEPLQASSYQRHLPRTFQNPTDSLLVLLIEEEITYQKPM
jgi:H+/Cl- antiporter ClcA